MQRDHQVRGNQVKRRFCNADLASHAKARKAEVDKLRFAGHPAVIFSCWQWAGVVLPLGIGYPYCWIKYVATSYEITARCGPSSRIPKRASNCSVSIAFDLHKPFGRAFARARRNGWLARPGLGPELWVTGDMKDREHHKPLRLDAVEHRIRKSRDDGAPYLAVYAAEHLRKRLDGFK
jgi:hypothetical protein